MANTTDGAISPQTIPDMPIPILDTTTLNNNTVSSNGTPPSTQSDNGVSPTTIPNAAIPPSPTASDVIGQALDTAQRKILGAFTFGKVGALQVGEAIPGVSGQILISPNGIIGEDENGTQRFILDDNGELILNTGTNQLILDALGIRSTTNFGNSAATGALGLNQHFNSSSPGLVTGASFTIPVTRNVYLIALATITNYTFWTGAENGLVDGQMDIRLDGVSQGQAFERGGVSGGLIYNNGNNNSITTTIHALMVLSPGTHTITLTAQRNPVLGDLQDFVVNRYRFTYFLLGT